MDTSSCICATCGERIDLVAEPGDGPDQDFVLDCPVCCRPNRIHLWQEPDGEWRAESLGTDE